MSCPTHLFITFLFKESHIDVINIPTSSTAQISPHPRGIAAECRTADARQRPSKPRHTTADVAHLRGTAIKSACIRLSIDMWCKSNLFDRIVAEVRFYRLNTHAPSG